MSLNFYMQIVFPSVWRYFCSSFQYFLVVVDVDKFSVPVFLGTILTFNVYFEFHIKIFLYFRLFLSNFMVDQIILLLMRLNSSSIRSWRSFTYLPVLPR